MATEGTGVIEVDSVATRAEVIAAASVDLPPDSEEAVLAELHLEWADRHRALVAVLADLRADLAVVLGDLRVVLAAVIAKAGSAR